MVCPKCKNDTPDGSAYCCHCGKQLIGAPSRAPRRPKGSGSIRKLPGRLARPWQALKNNISLGTFATKAEAQAVLDRLRSIDVTEAYNVSLAQIFERFCIEAYPGLLPKSQEDYDITWRRFASLADTPMRRLRTEDVQRLIDEDTARGLSRSHAEKIKKLYSQCCKVAMREDIIDKNYADFLRLPKGAAPKREVFSPEQIRVLEDNREDETVRLILILIYTGLRINELFTLRVEDIHLDDGYFVGGEKTDAGRDRMVPIIPDIREDLAYFMARATGELLISGYAGQRVARNWRRRDYYPTLERLGLPAIKPHGCRYTFATRAVAAKVQPEVLQKVIGHTKYTTTMQFYAQEDLPSAARELAKISSQRPTAKVLRVKKATPKGRKP